MMIRWRGGMGRVVSVLLQPFFIALGKLHKPIRTPPSSFNLKRLTGHLTDELVLRGVIENVFPKNALDLTNKRSTIKKSITEAPAFLSQAFPLAGALLLNSLIVNFRTF